jgi:hypothetical protein
MAVQDVPPERLETAAAFTCMVPGDWEGIPRRDELTLPQATDSSKPCRMSSLLLPGMLPAAEIHQTHRRTFRAITDAVGPQRRLNRSAMIRRSVRRAVRIGECFGRDDLSVRPDKPWALKRLTHLDTVARETWGRSATRACVQPSSRTSRTSFRRPSGVSIALA